MKKSILIVAIGALFCMLPIGAERKRLTETDLSDQEAAELRKAVVDYKKGRSPERAEQIIYKYYAQYPEDPLVKAKMNEKTRFYLAQPITTPQFE